MPTPMGDLRVSIESHNDVFESLLRLIPPKYYLVKDSNADAVSTIAYAFVLQVNP